MTCHIHVTKGDIKHGIRQDPFRDPISRAIFRRTGEHVFVGTSFIEIGNNWPPVVGIVKEFIERFDAGKKVKPFRFEINIE